MQVVQKLGLVNFHRHLVRISRTDLNDRLFHRNSSGRTDWSTEVMFMPSQSRRVRRVR
jgi:hypothetical protein